MKHIYQIQRVAIQFVVILIFSVFVGSCKNENAPSGYIMKFKTNGTTVEFTSQSSLVAAFANSGSQYTATFTGYDSNSNLSIVVYDNKAIAPVTYSGYQLNNTEFIGALIVYEDKNGKIYSQLSTNSDIKVVINEITSTTVRGTFSGTLTSSDNEELSVTNGEFYVWRAN